MILLKEDGTLPTVLDWEWDLKARPILVWERSSNLAFLKGLETLDRLEVSLKGERIAEGEDDLFGVSKVESSFISKVIMKKDWRLEHREVHIIYIYIHIYDYISMQRETYMSELTNFYFNEESL